MPTKMICLLDELRVCVDSAAMRADFGAEADARFAKLPATGKTIPWTEMRAYLEERVRARNT